MSRKWILVGVASVATVAAGVVVWRGRTEPRHYTGFVEGEERVLRSEVTGRILEVRFAEGEKVKPHAVVAVLDERDIVARIRAQQEAIEALGRQVVGQAERVRVTEATSTRDVKAQQAALREAKAEVEWAERNFTRERSLVESGASTPQLLDDARTRRDQARSQLDRARELLGRAEAALGNVDVARHELETLRKRSDQATAELAELEVLRSKYRILAPDVPTVVQTQYAWSGELAQPGTAILSVLDPRDKYVQIYVPVTDLARFRIGQRVQIELDSRPGRRVPGEVTFIADEANFTPEKIETRSDRIGQVYRAKIRILEDVESFKPGTEGNVYVG